MKTWASLGRVGLSGAVLLAVTSCEAPVARRAVPVAAAVDLQALVRQMAPGVGAVAQLPIAAAGPLRLAAAPLRAAAAPFLDAAASGDDAARARTCLTAAVYYEARSEPVEGQRAVAQVVLNRVRDRAFPHSVCGVVYQGVGAGRGCQFSFACDGSTARARDEDAWGRAERVAAAALNGEVMAAVGNATFYHAQSVLPWWAGRLARLGAIGHHIFYAWPGALGAALGQARYAGVEPGAPAAPEAVGPRVAVVAGGFGVTVHRNGGVADADVAAGPAVFAGVRVHRNAVAPGMDGGV